MSLFTDSRLSAMMMSPVSATTIYNISHVNCYRTGVCKRLTRWHHCCVECGDVLSSSEFQLRRRLPGRRQDVPLQYSTHDGCGRGRAVLFEAANVDGCPVWYTFRRVSCIYSLVYVAGNTNVPKSSGNLSSLARQNKNRLNNMISIQKLLSAGNWCMNSLG